MDTLFKVFWVLLLAWVVFGIIAPKKALGFMKNDSNKKRRYVLILGFVVFWVSVILLAIVSPPKSNTNKTSQLSETVDSAKTPEVDSVDLVTKEILERQRKEDSITAKKLKPLFDEQKDEFDSNGGYWIMPKDRPKYTNRNGVYCYFYMNKNGKPSNMRFKFQYCGDDWLFIQSLQIKVNDNVLNYIPQKVDRDNGGGDVWEWFDEGKTQNASVSGIVFNIAIANKVKIRINGQQYYKDITLTSKQIKSIKNTVDYYRALGGEL
ncbi:MAG: hypothetical protein J6T70_14925 [Bacteroidales bacterium]|nr:hypothetical protein [Bacteroidales bacterium]MBP5369096.1 hypothetical protein [Bacteroidales bacterium]